MAFSNLNTVREIKPVAQWLWEVGGACALTLLTGLVSEKLVFLFMLFMLMSFHFGGYSRLLGPQICRQAFHLRVNCMNFARFVTK